MADRADLIAPSLELVAERHGDPGPQIYARLFAAFSDTEALFVRDTTGAVRGACRDLSGPGWTADVDAAWTTRIERVIARTA